MKLFIFLGLLLNTPIASAQTFAECMALRELSSELISKARRAESELVNDQCPKEEFRKKLNNVSEWAWVTDVKARQMCRDEWRAETEYKYQDLFDNGYRSSAGAAIAMDLEVLGAQMKASSCPVGDLKWTNDSLVKPEAKQRRMSWSEKLSNNPSLKLWADAFPDLAEEERLRWEN